jgi:hypothetical protein
VGIQPEMQIPPYFLLLGPSDLGEGACGQKILGLSESKKCSCKEKNLLTGSGS